MPYFSMACCTTSLPILPSFGQAAQSGHGHMAAVYFEEVAQVGARIAAAEAIGAQHMVIVGI
jgi:hypothetical protein